jgi:ribosomal-protein-alanine N-acetyltransferase
MRYNIRPLEVKDIDEVVEGETKIFGKSLGYDMIYSDIKLNPYANYFVLEINGKVRGYIGLWITYELAEVINFYVDSEFQGMGFGKMLLEFAIELCTLSKVQSISLEVREENEKAKALYFKYGFVFSHKREQYYSDKTDALVLIKKLEVK